MCLIELENWSRNDGMDKEQRIVQKGIRTDAKEVFFSGN